MFRVACDVGLEGIVSKRLDHSYCAGRCKHWIKVKNPAHPAYGADTDHKSACLKNRSHSSKSAAEGRFLLDEVERGRTAAREMMAGKVVFARNAVMCVLIDKPSPASIRLTTRLVSYSTSGNFVKISSTIERPSGNRMSDDPTQPMISPVECANPLLSAK